MSRPVDITTGEIPFHIPAAGKPCVTWYKLFGNLTPKTRPLVALHGGPGASSDYLAILSSITQSHGIPLIIYDQIGNGLSTHLPEKNGDDSFWTVQLFIDELNNLLEHLGIADNYDLLGHSWGGMLAASFAVNQPKGLKHLILASSPADMGVASDEMNRLRALLPQEVQDVLDRCERDGTTDGKEYKDASDVFYSRHVCRLDPMPEPLAEGFAWIDRDPTVYGTMNGPSEFKIVGSLRTWSVHKDAHKINVPTLLTNGHYDEVTDVAVGQFFDTIPDVKWVKFAESSHVSHFEEEEKYMKTLTQFLTS